MVPSLSVPVILGNIFIRQNSRGIDFYLDIMLMNNGEKVPLITFSKKYSDKKEPLHSEATVDSRPKGPVRKNTYSPHVISCKIMVISPEIKLLYLSHVRYKACTI